MHLGPSAHRLIALEIYHEIDGKLSNRKEPTPESGSQSESGSGSEPETESTAESETELPTERHSRRGSAA